VEGNAVHWSVEAEAMVKAFTEAQKKMWESWTDLVRVEPALLGPFPGVADQWRELATQGLKGWTADSEQVAKDVAERLLGAQDAMMRVLGLSVSAWKAMAPKVESGEDWHTILAKYTDQMRQQLVQAPQEMARAIQDTGELWRLYLEEWQKLNQPWAESLRRAPWHFGQVATGDGSALIELTNLYWDAYERTFGRLLESPSLGHTREVNQDLLKGFDAWVDFRRANLEYQLVLAEAWAQTFEQLMGKLVSLGEKGETVQSLRGLLALWTDVVDEVFAKVFRSEEYIRIQGQLVNTATAYRLRELDIVEAFLKTSHMPTRRELDEAYHRIYDLRKEVKELKKALHEIRVELSGQAKRESDRRTPPDTPKQTTTSSGTNATGDDQSKEQR
jgi:polyhydroxyalkanoate synthase subunit PhaE